MAVDDAVHGALGYRELCGHLRSRKSGDLKPSNYEHIRSGQLTTATVPFAASLSALRHLVLNVIQMRANEKVTRVKARWPITRVQNVHTIRNRSYDLRVNVTMRKNGLAFAQPKDGIALLGDYTPIPQKALFALAVPCVSGLL
jgi:hypothetical protein